MHIGRRWRCTGREKAPRVSCVYLPLVKCARALVLVCASLLTFGRASLSVIWNAINCLRVCPGSGCIQTCIGICTHTEPTQLRIHSRTHMRAHAIHTPTQCRVDTITRTCTCTTTHAGMHTERRTTCACTPLRPRTLSPAQGSTTTRYGCRYGGKGAQLHNGYLHIPAGERFRAQCPVCMLEWPWPFGDMVLRLASFVRLFRCIFGCLHAHVADSRLVCRRQVHLGRV